MIVAVFTTVTVKICGITVWDGKKVMTVPWGGEKLTLITAAVVIIIIISIRTKSTNAEKQELSLHFNGHFPGGSGLAGTRMSLFWILLELTVMEVVSDDCWSCKTCKAPVKMSPPVNSGQCAI